MHNCGTQLPAITRGRKGLEDTSLFFSHRYIPATSGHGGRGRTRTELPTAPVRPLWPPRAGPKRLGAGYGFYLEVHRSHLASLDDPRARWPLP